jgi:hypothetical protein
MKRAHQYREYRNVRPFEAPDGIVSVLIDPATGQLATNCPNARPELFIAGTQPVETCRLHGVRGSATQVAAWDVPEPAPAAPDSGAPADRRAVAQRRPPSVQQPGAPQKPPQAEPARKRGFFGRIRDLFR